MEFRNYCLIVLDDVEGVKDEILIIAETNRVKPKYLDAKGIMIATFVSALSPQEISNFLEENDRSFFVFELDDETSGINIMDTRIHNHLFQPILNIKDNLEDMSKKLMNNIIETSGTTVEEVAVEVKNKINVEELTKKEADNLLNELLEKGSENWTDEDIRLMKELSKK